MTIRGSGNRWTVLRNELGRGRRADGSIAEVIERGGKVVLIFLVLRFLLADGVLADDGTEAL
jgi:hypothetical protein